MVVQKGAVFATSHKNNKTINSVQRRPLVFQLNEIGLENLYDFIDKHPKGSITDYLKAHNVQKFGQKFTSKKLLERKSVAAKKIFEALKALYSEGICVKSKQNKKQI